MHFLSLMVDFLNDNREVPLAEVVLRIENAANSEVFERARLREDIAGFVCLEVTRVGTLSLEMTPVRCCLRIGDILNLVLYLVELCIKIRFQVRRN